MMREQLSKRKNSVAKSPTAIKKSPAKPGSTKSVKKKSRPTVIARDVGKKSLQTSVKTVAKKSIAVPKSSGKKTPAKTPVAVAPAKTKSAKPIPKVAAKKTPLNASIKSIVAPKIEVKLRTSTKSVAKPVAAPATIPRRQIAGQALRAFEQAVKVFNLRQFSEAKAMFEALQQRYHQEVEIIARSQTYIQVCKVKLTPNRISPRDADEFYDRGVVALNVGNFVQARTFFEKSLKLRPDDSFTLYSLAATHAQSGTTDQALNYLEQAVQRQPRLRQRALNDNDFFAIKENRRFLELIGASSPFDLLEARRA